MKHGKVLQLYDALTGRMRPRAWKRHCRWIVQFLRTQRLRKLREAKEAKRALH